MISKNFPRYQDFPIDISCKQKTWSPLTDCGIICPNYYNHSIYNHYYSWYQFYTVSLLTQQAERNGLCKAKAGHYKVAKAKSISKLDSKDRQKIEQTQNRRQNKTELEREMELIGSHNIFPIEEERSEVDQICLERVDLCNRLFKNFQLRLERADDDNGTPQVPQVEGLPEQQQQLGGMQ